MALPRFLPNSKPEPSTYSRLADDPEIIPIWATLEKLKALRLQLGREDEALSLEGRFHARPARPDSERDQALVARLKSLQTDRQSEQAPSAAPGEHSPEVALALALVDGSLPAPPKNDRAARRLAIARELEVVDLAIRVQDRLYDDTADRISRAKCQALATDHAALSMRMFRAAQELAQATDLERDFRAAILQGGYGIHPDLISPPVLTGALVIGSERNHDSQISTVKRHLEAKGILKS